MNAPRRTDSAATDARLQDWAGRLVVFCLRHWLALLLTPMLIFVTLPFLAPVALHNGWTATGQTIYWLYRPFCHQLPQRSWFLFGLKLTYTLDEINQVYPYTDPWQLRQFLGTPQMGWKVAWSDRMVSFYTLTPLFGLIYALLRRAGQPLQPLSWRALWLTLTPLVLDGFTHLLNDVFSGDYRSGFRDTNAWLAFLTGNAFPGFYAGDSFGTFNWWLRLLTGALAAWGLTFSLFPFLNSIIEAETQRQI